MMIFSPIAECGKGSWGREGQREASSAWKQTKKPHFLSANDDDPQTHSSVRQMGSRQALNNSNKRRLYWIKLEANGTRLREYI